LFIALLEQDWSGYLFPNKIYPWHLPD